MNNKSKELVVLDSALWALKDAVGDLTDYFTIKRCKEVISEIEDVLK